MSENGYRRLEIWQMARQISIDIHAATLKELPKFEMYETGSQIRRSSKSIRANIVEGYGRRMYKNDFIKHLVYAIGSCDETIDHWDTLHETKSLSNQETYQDIKSRLVMLGKKLYSFHKAVSIGHKSEK